MGAFQCVTAEYNGHYSGYFRILFRESFIKIGKKGFINGKKKKRETAKSLCIRDR